MKPRVALISYNPLFPYQIGIETVNGIEILFLPNTFLPKSPASVRSDDENFQLLLAYQDTLEKIIVFAGKVESGTLEIITLFATTFAYKKESLFFVLCDHGLEEKYHLLSTLGISDAQKTVFTDGHEQCQEGPILKG